jgi:hypothetical protein
MSPEDLDEYYKCRDIIDVLELRVYENWSVDSIRSLCDRLPRRVLHHTDVLKCAAANNHRNLILLFLYEYQWPFDQEAVDLLRRNHGEESVHLFYTVPAVSFQEKRVDSSQFIDSGSFLQ